MNLEHGPTREQLRDLLAPCDDTAGHHVLWVTKIGEVKLTRLAAGRSPAVFQPLEMQLRFETFLAGNEYVGPEAAADEEWIRDLLGRLLREWGKAKGQPSVVEAERF